MLLYHGSNLCVKCPMLVKSDRKLDFGSGFYVTTNFDQARRWAQLTAKRRASGVATVTIYNYDEALGMRFKVLRFDRPSEEWLRFVSANRKGISSGSEYDIVIGPVANDRTMPVISLYFAGIYDEKEAIKRLLPQKLNDQYAFKTESSLRALNFREEVRL